MSQFVCKTIISAVRSIAFRPNQRRSNGCYASHLLEHASRYLLLLADFICDDRVFRLKTAQHTSRAFGFDVGRPTKTSKSGGRHVG